MARTPANILEREEAEEKPRRGIRLIDKVRSVSGEFDFTALLSGIRERPHSKESDEQNLPLEAAEAVPPPIRTVLAPRPMPSVLEEQAAELRNIWNPQTPSNEPEVVAPPAPWQVNAPSRPESRPVRIVRSVRPRERTDFPTYLRGAAARATLCLAIIAFGFASGAGGAAVVNQMRPYPAYAASQSAPQTAAKNKSNAGIPARDIVPNEPLLTRIKLPITLLGSMALLWILGVPLTLGALKKVVFIALAMGVLLTSSWAGSDSTIHTIQSRRYLTETTSMSAASIQKSARAATPTSKTTSRRRSRRNRSR